MILGIEAYEKFGELLFLFFVNSLVEEGVDAAASTVEGVVALIIGGISAEMESRNLRFAFISENGTLREVRRETEARKLCGKIP